MPDVNMERLQSLARTKWGVELPEALRRATGIDQDMNGIFRSLGGSDNPNGLSGDTIEEILNETTTVVGNGTPPSASGWTRKVMSIGTAPSVLTAVDPYVRATAPAGAVAHGDGGLRDVWLRDGITGSDFEITGRFELPGWNTNPTGSGVIFPQAGIAVRVTETDRRRIIAINNNVVYGLGHMNIGAWSSALDGTGFMNRQTSFTALTNPLFPYNFKFRVIGNFADVWYWGDNESFPGEGNPDRYKRVNLNVDAGGEPVGNETPTGIGGVGLIVAHLGNHATSRIDFSNISIRVID